MGRSSQQSCFSWEGQTGRIFVEPVYRTRKSDRKNVAKSSLLEALEELNSWSSLLKETLSFEENEPSRKEKTGSAIRHRESARLATFREFYRSRDGKVTIFEDEHGHLTSVDSSRLV